MSRAKVIVFDEPTSSLTRADVERLFETIARLRQQGLGVIYISHFLEEIRRVCDSYTVLRDGESVAERRRLPAPPSRRLVSLMVGRSIDELYPNRAAHPGRSPVNRLEPLRHNQTREMFRSIFGAAKFSAWLASSAPAAPNCVRSIFALDPVRTGRGDANTNFPRPTPKARIRAGLASSPKIAQARASRNPDPSPTTSLTAGCAPTAAGAG